MSRSSSGITREFIFDFPPPRRNMLFGLISVSAVKRDKPSVSAVKRDKLSVLAFEVANTIVKGLNLRQFLLDENIQILKTEILHTKGVQLLVSTDIEELLRIAAADKREEFEIFCREVARFGNMCTDPQWHNLDRLFASNFVLKERREMTDITMQLVNLAQHTIELYHECISLDRYEQHYRRTLEDVESFRLPQKGKSATSVIQHEINRQRKIVRNLQKKSLWSRNLEEVMEMLVYVANSILKAFREAFGENAAIPTNKDDETYKKTDRLGVSGLDLHYANLITQIADIGSRPTFLHPNMRDALYNCIPANIRACLRSYLQALDSKEEMTMPEIKTEMDKILHWLVPVATNTIKSHQSFRGFGEWANTGFVFGKTAGSDNIIRLQTLDHADKHKVDQYILNLLVLLHYRQRIPKDLPTQPPTRPHTSKGLILSNQLQRVNISREDKNLLDEVAKQRPPMVHGGSKSQEFVLSNKKLVVLPSTGSCGSSLLLGFQVTQLVWKKTEKISKNLV